MKTQLKTPKAPYKVFFCVSRCHYGISKGSQSEISRVLTLRSGYKLFFTVLIIGYGITIQKTPWLYLYNKSKWCLHIIYVCICITLNFQNQSIYFWIIIRILRSNKSDLVSCSVSCSILVWLVRIPAKYRGGGGTKLENLLIEISGGLAISFHPAWLSAFKHG